jgi:hypothetical protein
MSKNEYNNLVILKNFNILDRITQRNNDSF